MLEKIPDSSPGGQLLLVAVVAIIKVGQSLLKSPSDLTHLAGFHLFMAIG